MTPRIVPATELSMDALRQGMVAAFADYAVPMAPTPEQFDFMMRQRGLDVTVSCAAVDDSKVAGVWLVSVDGTAGYLISSGTDPRYRGRGLAKAMAQHSFAALGRSGATTFQTEVMKGNDMAKALYLRLGMEVARELTCYDLSGFESAAQSVASKRVPWAEVAGQAAGCRDWKPTWQNDDAALARVADNLDVVATWDADGLAGYAAVIRSTGVLAQIAVAKRARRKGLGRTLIAALRVGAEEQALRVLNADVADAGFAAFMTGIGARVTVGQFELRGAI